MSNPTKFVFNPLSSNFDVITNTDAEGLTLNAPIISSTVPAIPVTGQMWMNSALNVKVPGGTLQVGEEMYMNVINKTGSILPNGSFIYISGVDSGYPKAILAQANSLISHQTIALTTNTIAIDAISNVTTVGLVHDLKTDVDSEGHAVTAGDKIWLSKSVPGGWINVEPYAPDYSIILGTVTVVSATVGEILVDIEINNARDLAIISQEPTGFDIPANVGIAYDSTTQAVTVSGANWKVYWRGKEVLEIPTGVVPVAHDNVLDHTYFLYWDGTGINNGFNWTTDAFPGFDKVLIAYVYYYTGNIFCNRECHGLMDWRAHQEFHENVGIYLFSGGQLTAGTYVLNPTAGTHTTAQNTYGTEIAVIKDEDLPTSIPAWIEGTYTTAYRLGVSGDWVFSTVATVPYHFNGGTNFIQYNQLTGGAWQLTDVTENNYYNTFIFYVPTTSDVGSQKYRAIVVADQGISTTLAGALARTTLNLDVGNLKNILVESMPYIRITWLKNSSGAGAYPAGVVGRCAIVNITYNSGSSKSLILASGLTPGDHSSLSGRTDLNSHPISAIDSATLGSVIFSSATGLAEDNTNFFWDNTNKRLGIGIAVPTANMHIVGTDGFSLEKTTAITTATVSTIVLKATSSGNMSGSFGPSIDFQIRDTALVDNTIAFIKAIRGSADNSGILSFTCYNAGTLTERMRITNAGLIGIGLTDPASQLHQDLGDATATYHQFTAGTTTGQTATDGLLVGIDATGKAIINQQEALALGINTSGTERVHINAAGDVGINCVPRANTGLDISNGDYSIIGGADVGLTTRTNNTSKHFKIFYAPYTNSSLPLYLAIGSSTATGHDITIGGGLSEGYAATNINFYTAAVVNTLAGTLRFTISGTGIVTIDQNLIISGTAYGVQLSGGTTAQRTASPVAGMIRYNSDTLTHETYQNSVWGAQAYCGSVTTAIGSNTLFTPPTNTLSYTAQVYISDTSLYAQLTIYAINKNGTWNYTVTSVGDFVGAIAVNSGTGVLTYTAEAIGVAKIKCEFINF